MSTCDVAGCNRPAYTASVDLEAWDEWAETAEYEFYDEFWKAVA